VFRNIGLLLERIWRGEFPLGKIFWVGAISITLAVGFYSFAAPYFITFLPKTYWSFGLIFIGLLFCPFPFFVLLWLGLVWRTGWGADKQRKTWLILASAASCIFLFLVVLQAQIVASVVGRAYSDILGDPQYGSRGVQVDSTDKSVLVYGYISRYIPMDLATTLDQHPDTRLVEFNSIGGRVGPAEQIADLIRSRGLDTRVSVRCISACTLAFSGGRERIMRAGASFGFHAATVGDSIGEKQTENSRQRLIAAGVAKPFVARAFRERRIWYPSAQELKEAGVVTVILPNQ
jgi:hypothetical protein